MAGHWRKWCAVCFVDRRRELVTPLSMRRRGKLARALMAEEVVAREDVVDLEALRAREAFANVALEQTLAVDDAGSLPVEQAADRGALTRLAAG